MKFRTALAASLYIVVAASGFAQSIQASGERDHSTVAVYREGDSSAVPQHTCGPLPWLATNHAELVRYRVNGGWLRDSLVKIKLAHPKMASKIVTVADPECMRQEIERAAVLVHPYHAVAKHPKAGCLDTAVCGETFLDYWGVNMRTSAGTTWQANIMADTSTPPVNNQGNYLALTNTAVTPAEADTSLSGEISSNGLSRAQGTYTNNSTTLAVPGAPTVTPQGSAGSTTYYYWVVACNQGICTTVSSSGTTATANATLSTANNVQVSWTPVSGAATYYVFRTTSNSAPTGATTAVAGLTGTSAPSCSAATCYINDIANSLSGTSVTIASSNLTNYGTFTLVHTWTATAAQSAQAFGVFTAASSGTMIFEGTFTQVSLNTSDTFQLTETVVF